MSVHIRRYRYMKGGLAGEGVVVVEATRIEEPHDLVQLRAKDDWSEGQLAVLTYPSADPEAYVGTTSPLSMFSVRVAVGNWLVKGTAGDLFVLPDAQFRDEFEEWAA